MIEDTPTAKSVRTWPKWLRITTLIGAPLVIVVGVIASIWLYQEFTNPIPGNLRRQMKVPLYYPTKLPSGYEVDKASFTIKEQALIFNIKGPDGKNIAVSEQRLPPDLDLSTRKTTGPAGFKSPDQRNFKTSVGEADISLWGDKYVSSLVSLDTWIILNVTGFTGPEAEQITRAFKPL